MEVLRHLNASERMDITIGAAEVSALSIFRHTIDADHHVIIMTDREKQKVPVGYAVLVRPHHTERWQVSDVDLTPGLRGKSYISNLYRGLTAAGYKLQSGKVLSPQAERVWQSLGRAGIAFTLDVETGEVEPFNNNPIDSGDMLNGEDPRFYWVTEGQRLITTFYRGYGKLTEGQKQAWLNGAPAYRGDDTSLWGVSTFCIDGEDDEPPEER